MKVTDAIACSLQHFTDELLCLKVGMLPLARFVRRQKGSGLMEYSYFARSVEIHFSYYCYRGVFVSCSS